MRKNKNKGFTIIELLIVIAILGILGSILFVSISGKPTIKARDTKRIGDLNSLRLAVELYFSENQVYPTSLSSLVPDYIQAVPKDPRYADGSTNCGSTLFDDDYAYGVNSTTSPTRYYIAACLEGTRPAGSSTENFSTYTPALNCNSNAGIYCISN